jgi:hypothetical protein
MSHDKLLLPLGIGLIGSTALFLQHQRTRRTQRKIFAGQQNRTLIMVQQTKRLDRLLRTMVELRLLHDTTKTGRCHTCDQTWPCQTFQTLSDPT